MKYKTSRRHWCKYSQLLELWGVEIQGDTFLGHTREQMRMKLAEDQHLNNIALYRWDAAGARLVGRQQPFDIDGNRYEVGKEMEASMAEAVCAMKLAAVLWCGAEVEVDDE